MLETLELKTSTVLPTAFKISEVSNFAALKLVPSPPPSLGPLAAFTGTWTGSGFNTIFRPDSPKTPTPLPIPIPVTNPPNDNILELNLTTETLSFSSSLGSVPNRGMVQADAFLNGVPYLQAINDVTVAGQSIGIHLEPGLWMAVPATTDPAETVTVTRMASIPHGTTILAQGTSATTNGPPAIPPVDITPFLTAAPHTKIPFASQTAATQKTPRIPQDLTSFIAAGTITQAMLTDPNTVLRNHIAGQAITQTTTISIATSPAAPLFGGGTDNIAFLLGNAAATTPNAQAVTMQATFWIETVMHTIVVPVFHPGEPALTLEAEGPHAPGRPVPKFTVLPPHAITAPRTIKVPSTQIQYSQTVFLNFNRLTWPHVSVATLVPSEALPVLASAWA